MGEDARLGLIAVIGALVLLALDRRGEQLARADDVVGADAACEQAVVANAVKSFWQDMRKRRMNSSIASLMTFCRAWPSTR